MRRILPRQGKAVDIVEEQYHISLCTTIRFQLRLVLETALLRMLDHLVPVPAIRSSYSLCEVVSDNCPA
jgi:hypothetical protein